MKNWFALCMVAASTTFFVAPQQADAAAAGNTYNVEVFSTYSGQFSAIASFGVNTFVLDAEGGDGGSGTFFEIGPFVFAQGENGGYEGGFTAFTIGNNFIIGSGTGNYGDIFWFYGF